MRARLRQGWAAGLSALALALQAVGVAPTLAGEPATHLELAQDTRGPVVMLCLYGRDGRIRAGHQDCPPTADPSEPMMAEAHCFYNADGHLWRGLPRCPHEAPDILIRDLKAGDAPEG